MMKKKVDKLRKFESALSKRAARIVEAKVPADLRTLHEMKLALSGNISKKIAQVNDEISRKCTHNLIFEIARRRIEATSGARVIPSTRVCLVCWIMEDAVQQRDSKGRLRATFKKLTVQPIRVLRSNYGAITVTLGKRPIAQYVKAILAAERFGDDVIERIMFSNLYDFSP